MPTFSRYSSTPILVDFLHILSIICHNSFYSELRHHIFPNASELQPTPVTHDLKNSFTANAIFVAWWEVGKACSLHLHGYVLKKSHIKILTLFTASRQNFWLSEHSHPNLPKWAADVFHNTHPLRTISHFLLHIDYVLKEYYNVSSVKHYLSMIFQNVHGIFQPFFHSCWLLDNGNEKQGWEGSGPMGDDCPYNYEKE